VLATASSPIRLTRQQWDAYSGQLGHQHAPQNDHWDPGRLDLAAIAAAARAELGAPPPTPPPQLVWSEEDMNMHLVRVRWVNGSPTLEDWHLVVGQTAHHLATNEALSLHRDVCKLPVRDLPATTWAELVAAGTVKAAAPIR
jgi:hypothetical protein